MTRSPLAAVIAAAALISVAACEGAQGTLVARRHVVEMRSFAFIPDSLTVAAGDTVIWVNRDFAPHTATASAGGWDTGVIAAGDSLLRVVSEADGGDYHCVFHPGMRGRILVR